MKVFLATLFFVGFAAAVPCPILRRMKHDLLRQARVLRSETETVIESKGPWIEEGISNFVLNPSIGSDDLKALISDVAMRAFYNGTYNFLEMDSDIKSFVSDLKKAPPKLVKDGVYPIIDNLRQQLIHNLLIDRGTVLHLLEVARQLFEDDVKAIASYPALAVELEKKRIADWRKFEQGRMQYLKKTEQLIQDTFDAIEKLYQQ